MFLFSIVKPLFAFFIGNECKGDLFIFVRWKFTLKILFPKIVFFILAHYTIFMKNMKIFFCNG